MTTETKGAATAASLSDSDKAALAAAEALDRAANPTATSTQAAPTTTDQRPAWLPEKFKSAEDMAKAYAELEKKQGAPAADKPQESTTAPSKEQVQADVAKAGLDFGALTTEYVEKGKLSDATYTKLAEKGFDKAAVDTYIAGAQAKADAYDKAAFDAAGSKDAYTAIAKWATENLSKAEADAYNAAVSSGDLPRMTLAVKGLRAAFEAVNGAEPKLVSTTKNGVASDVAPYNTLQELSADMAKPEYKTDPAFKANVEKRAKLSTFGLQQYT